MDNVFAIANSGLSVGFTCSCFDLFHAGHVMMLEEARAQCDYLVVGLQTDPTIDRPEKNKPVQTITERHLQLRACKWVDEVVLYETEKDLEQLLRTLPISVRILGEEYKEKFFTGKDICLERQIELYYNTRAHSYSTTELRNRIKGL